jgi:TolA-binding protein
VNDVDPAIKAKSIYWKAEILYKQDKYEAAVKQYRSFIFNPGSVNTSLYNLGHYNLGYCYFKLGNYNDAQSWFRKYLAKRESGQEAMYGDALVRTADCHYALRDFSTAIKYYNDAIAVKTTSTDYAYFQKGLIQGLQNDQPGKVSTLTSLIGSYSKSRFRGDALYERGRAHMTLGDNDRARTDFNALLRETPSHPYAKKAQLNIALMLYNDKQDDQAVAQYKKVVTQYPGSPEATEALLGLKSIYVGNGEPESYFNFVKDIPNASVSTGAQDSITYEAAEQQYMKGDFENGAKSFSKYLQMHPNGGYKLNATFYLAECQYRNKDFSSALASYEKITTAGSNLFTEKSLAKAASIHFNDKRYDKAIGHFLRLEQIAELRENQLNAQTGLMRSYYSNKQHELAIDYAKKLIEGDKVSNDIVSEAHLIYARSAMEINDLSAAKREYSIIAKQSSMTGAEAKYSLALIEYKMGNFKSSQGKCYDVAKQVPSYDFWIAKSFILLADNCIALKDTFQAKATIQSILENYEKDPTDPEDIRQIAQDKLKSIEQTESGEEKKPKETPEPETDLNKEQQD